MDPSLDRRKRLLTLAGVGVVMLVCCAGPALLAAGVLGAVGGVLRNGWLIALAAAVLLGAVAWTIQRRRRRSRSGRPDSATDTC